MTRLKRVVYTVCALLLLFALWNLRSLQRSEKTARQLQQELTAAVHPAEASAQVDASVSSGNGGAVLNPWFDALYERNHDLAGWLTIPNTVIDYPVMQTAEDRDFYLTHDFDGRTDRHGTLFADVASRIGDGCNLIVYGHHMADGTMFQNLMKYRDAAFCRENGDILYATRFATRHFRPAAVLRVSEEEARAFPYHTMTELADGAAYEAFFQGCQPYADWMAEELPSYPAMLLTLSTCEYSKQDGRLVVVCACTEVETARNEPGADDSAGAAAP